MNKERFLSELERGLFGLDDSDIKSSLDYYTEMIDDRTESGMSEEDAVSELGSPAVAARDIMSNMSFKKIVKTKIKPSRSLRAWEIVLIALGSPIWVSFIAAAACVVLSVYVSLWAVFASVWVVDISLAAVGVVGMVEFVLLLISSPLSAFLYLGSSMFLLGVSVPLFFGCYKLTSLFVKFHAQITRFVKKMIIGRGRKQ